MIVESKKTGVKFEANRLPDTRWELRGIDSDLRKVITNRSFKSTYREVVDNLQYLSQSKLANYLQCPHQFYECYSKKEDTVFTKQGSALHATLEDYYDPDRDPNLTVEQIFEDKWAKMGADEYENYEEWKELLPKYVKKEEDLYPNPCIIARELEFNVMIGGVPIRGFIDRIDRIDEDTILIIDYKSNMMPYSDKEVKESTQFKIYSMAVRDESLKSVLGEFKNVICAYSLLRTNQRQTVQFSMMDLATFASWLQLIWDRMKSGENKDECKINKYCSYCSIRHKCDKYKDMTTNPNAVIPVEGEIQLAAIEEELEQVKMVEKAIKARRAEIETIIKSKIADNQGQLITGSTQWTLKSASKKTYTVEDILKITGQDIEVQKELQGMFIKQELSATAVKKIKSLKGKDLSLIEKVKYSSPTLVAKVVDPQLVSNDQRKIE